MGRPHFIAGIAVASTLISTAVCGQAMSSAPGQIYPYKPVRIIAGSVGSSGDFSARLIAQAITGSLGRPVIVENRFGSVPASGELVAKALPDGYTLLFVPSSLWLWRFMQEHMPYDPVLALAPITSAGSTPAILLVQPSLGIKSVKELVAMAKAKPGELNYGQPSTGSAMHIASEMLKSMAGVNIVSVPYKGAAPALNGLMGGQVQLMFSSLAPALPQVKSGRLIGLAVSSEQPSALAPGIPTIAAAGYPGFDVMSTQGLFAPVKTPAVVIQRLNRAVVERLTTVKLVAQTGSHWHHIDFAACTDKGIIVAAPSKKVASGVTTAELTWALILASLRNLPHEVEQLKQGAWQTTVGMGLRSQVLGIYALGVIGSMVAQVGKAFGMRVMCWGRETSCAKVLAAGYEMPKTREEFFSTVDILSLHIFYGSETHGIITAQDLARMKPTALLVNTSRARLIQEGALVAALKQGRPGRAAVDVYETEPIVNGEHPLLKLPNVICTPHLGYAVTGTFENLYSKAVDSVLAYAAGTPVNVLNPEALH